MDTPSMDAFSSNAWTLVIGGATVLAIALCLLHGWALRCAVRICGGDHIGLLRAAMVAVASIIASSGAVVGVGFAMDRPGPLIIAAASVIGAMVAICLLLRMGPVRGLGVYLIHSLIGSLLTVAACIVAGLVVVFTIPRSTVEEFSQLAQQRAMSLRGEAALSGTALSGAGIPLERSPIEAPRLVIESAANDAPDSLPLSATGDAGDVRDQLREILEQTLYRSEPSPESQGDGTRGDAYRAPVPHTPIPDRPGMQSNPFVK